MSQKTAIIFPGQGSQKLGMLLEYYEKFDTFQNTINEAREYLNYNLWDIIQNDEEKLNKTEFTQPAILATSYAVFKVLLKQKPNLKIQYFAGHSLGEYTALLASQCISYEDALHLVSIRGKLMQHAVTNKKCAMSAILGLSNEEVMLCCKEASDIGIVEAANYNSPGQVVISGEKAAVEKANALAKEKGAKRAQILPISVPSHCSLMKHAAQQFKFELDKIEFRKPMATVIQNLDAKSYSDPEKIKQALAKQLYNPVLWSQSIQELVNLNVNKIIECGPKKILSGLVKKINSNLNINHTSTIENLNNI